MDSEIKAPDTYTFNKRKFDLIRSDGNIVLYCNEDNKKHYELHILKLSARHTVVDGVHYTDKDDLVITLGSLSMWGISGFSYITEKKANEKFDELVKSNKYKATMEDLSRKNSG